MFPVIDMQGFDFKNSIIAIKLYLVMILNLYLAGMHDIIGLLSESADNGFKCKYRHRPNIKNCAICLANKRNTLTHMSSGCVSD